MLPYDFSLEEPVKPSFMRLADANIYVTAENAEGLARAMCGTEPTLDARYEAAYEIVAQVYLGLDTGWPTVSIEVIEVDRAEKTDFNHMNWDEFMDALKINVFSNETFLMSLVRIGSIQELLTSPDGEVLRSTLKTPAGE